MNDENVNLSAESAQKKDILTSAKQFFGTALSPLKSRDNSQLIEDFTNEMTLVAEGLSEDQERISRLLDNVASQQTIFENDTGAGFAQIREELRRQDGSIGELRKDLDRLNRMLTEKKQKPSKAEGWTGLLRQATWLVAIASGAAVLIALINRLL